MENAINICIIESIVPWPVLRYHLYQLYTISPMRLTVVKNGNVLQPSDDKKLINSRLIEAYSGPCQIRVMNIFAKIVNA